MNTYCILWFCDLWLRCFFMPSHALILFDSIDILSIHYTNIRRYGCKNSIKSKNWIWHCLWFFWAVRSYRRSVTARHHQLLKKTYLYSESRKTKRLLSRKIPTMNFSRGDYFEGCFFYNIQCTAPSTCMRHSWYMYIKNC